MAPFPWVPCAHLPCTPPWRGGNGLLGPRHGSGCRHNIRKVGWSGDFVVHRYPNESCLVNCWVFVQVG